MAEIPGDILKRIINPLIFGNIIIALCTLSLFLETYLQLGVPLKLDGLAALVFFATLFLYNFHRLMGIRRIKPEDFGIITGWAAKHQFTLFMLSVIGAGGVAIFVFQTSLVIFMILVLLGGISMLYELPIVRHNQQFHRLRNLWIHKAFMITTVWSLATVLLPAMNANFPLTNYHVWLVLAGRMLFIFILALCFDARDVDFDRKDDLVTIPIRYGEKITMDLYKTASAALLLVVVMHYIVLDHYWGIGIAMVASTALTYYVVTKTFPRRSDYYYIFFVDGLMIAQFLFVWILSSFK